MLGAVNERYAFETVDTKTRSQRIVRQLLLVSGILSSLLYVVMNIVAAMRYPGYSTSSQTVSELSAIGAPTRPLWLVLAAIYSGLLMAFGWGIRMSASGNRNLRTAGSLVIIYAVISLTWRPMHQREVLGAGGGTVTDSLHIAFTVVAVILMLLVIGFCAKTLGDNFRIYSVATVVIMMLFGIMTGIQSPMMEANLETPMLGVWERVSIGGYLVWNMVLATILLRANTKPV